ncbi:hypothetical protein [Bradyrhizobium sp.]|uniref:hypothetical protein n=1 Tax=Bradyrhizobium sp. TaxID=376 RepID=UPI003C27D7E4
MNADDVISSQDRPDISKAQHPGSRIQGQYELVPGMPRSEVRLANADRRKNDLYLAAGRHNEPHLWRPLLGGLLREDIIQRDDNFVRIALNTRHALAQKATIDRPASPVIHTVVAVIHH